jgi:hypothetical protein
MQGHVSKASDVFAFGILLNEIVTGRRAYAGVPVPLLPHQVCVGCVYRERRGWQQAGAWRGPEHARACPCAMASATQQMPLLNPTAAAAASGTHQVAVAGLRPEWPPGLPPACGWLQQLAEQCWAQQPQDR